MTWPRWPDLAARGVPGASRVLHLPSRVTLASRDPPLASLPSSSSRHFPFLENSAMHTSASRNLLPNLAQTAFLSQSIAVYTPLQPYNTINGDHHGPNSVIQDSNIRWTLPSKASGSFSVIFTNHMLRPSLAIKSLGNLHAHMPNASDNRHSTIPAKYIWHPTSAFQLAPQATTAFSPPQRPVQWLRTHEVSFSLPTPTLLLPPFASYQTSHLLTYSISFITPSLAPHAYSTSSLLGLAIGCPHMHAPMTNT